MVDDLLSIVVDPYIPPANTDFRNGRENWFEKIYAKDLNQHRGYNKTLLYISPDYDYETKKVDQYNFEKGIDADFTIINIHNY